MKLTVKVAAGVLLILMCVPTLAHGRISWLFKDETGEALYLSSKHVVNLPASGQFTDWPLLPDDTVTSTTDEGKILTDVERVLQREKRPALALTI
jgi:hypothetical protein